MISSNNIIITFPGIIFHLVFMYRFLDLVGMNYVWNIKKIVCPSVRFQWLPIYLEQKKILSRDRVTEHLHEVR